MIIQRNNYTQANKKILISSMPKLLFTIALFASLFTYAHKSLAQDNTQNDQLIKLKTKYKSQEGEDYNFIKRNLVYLSFREAISTQLKKMNLDPNLFWTKYDEKFALSFVDKEESLRKRNKDNPDLNSLIKRAKFNSKERFGNLKRAIKSYSVDKISRSTKYPLNYYMSIHASVDKSYLSSLYLSYTRSEENLKDQILYLSTDIILENFKEQDIGLRDKQELTSALNSSWQKWLRGTFKDLVSEVKIINSKDISLKSMEQELRESNQLNQQDKVNTLSGSNIAKNEFESGLFLRFNLNIRKFSDDKLSQSRQYSFSGDFVLINLRQKRLINSFDIKPKKQKFSYKKMSELSSKLASFAYSLPLNELRETARAMFNSGGVANLMSFKVSNLSSIQELFDLMKIISERGVTKQFTTSLKSFDGKNGVIELNYQGSKESALSLLKKLDNQVMPNNSLVKVDTTNSSRGELSQTLNFSIFKKGQ